MKSLAVILTAIALGACHDVPVTGQEQQTIVNGEPSESGAHPETVFLWLGGSACTGTLIAPKVVLTARHCVEGIDINVLDVYFGNDPSGSGEWRNPEETVYHSSGDIALITLMNPAPVAPIPFRRQTLSASDVGRDVFIVGFGDTGTTDASGVKREGNTAVDDLVGDLLYVGATGSKTCFGDSGGPTFITVGGQKFVIGVSSFVTSDECQLGISGNVRADYYDIWIDDFVSSQAEPTCEIDALCAQGCESIDLDCPCNADDGLCSAACDGYVDVDPDCEGCGRDGSCQAGCPDLDPDCCDEDSICNAACTEHDPDCSYLGDTCTSDEQCQTDLCAQYGGESRCVALCEGGSGCPSGFDCVEGGACWPEEGGCRLGSGTMGLGWLGLAILALAGRRRRS